MRFYDPELQMLALLYEQLILDAEKSGETPAEIFAQAFSRISVKHGDALRLPGALCDLSLTAEERYAHLCTQMDAFREMEAMRRAEWRMATEATGQSVLDALIDDATLPQTCVLLRESADTLVLATYADEAQVEGFRLHAAHTSGGVGVPILLSTLELSVALSGGLSLVAMSAVGEVQITFSHATAATDFYDYSQPADPTSVLLLPHIRVSYCLHKLLQKALRTEPTPLSGAEEALLPLAIGASFFCGNADSLVMAESFASACGNEWLAEQQCLFSVAVNAFFECASATKDGDALRLLAPMQRCNAVQRCKRGIRRLGAHLASAKGERLCRAVLMRLRQATACYPPSLLSGASSASLPLVRETVDLAMRERGYTGAWPNYRKEHVLPSARLFCVEGIYPVLAFAGTRVLSLVDCVPFLQGETICVRFASGTILLRKNEDADGYLDSDSAAYGERGRRRLQQFAAGLVLREEDRPEQLDVAQTATCAAKSAELVTLDREEHLRVVHASRRPIWMAVLLWLFVGLCCGVACGLAALGVRGLCVLLGGAALAPFAPAWIGIGCGVTITLTMLLLTILGRRKL